MDSSEDKASGSGSLEQFVLKAVPEMLEGCLIVSSAVVFEYLDSEGKIHHGILHHHDLPHDEALNLVIVTARELEDE